MKTSTIIQELNTALENGFNELLYNKPEAVAEDLARHSAPMENVSIEELTSAVELWQTAYLKPMSWQYISSCLTQQRMYTIVGEYSEMGKSRYVIECPFCRTHVTAYKWSLYGSGKKCSCGALLSSSGDAYHWKINP